MTHDKQLIIDAIRRRRERLKMSTHPPERIEIPVSQLDVLFNRIDELEATLREIQDEDCWAEVDNGPGDCQHCIIERALRNENNE